MGSSELRASKGDLSDIKLFRNVLKQIHWASFGNESAQIEAKFWKLSGLFYRIYLAMIS